jgi:catechol 2,3-dioxygenase-like lactoylglutathione lyase family enzyme
MISGLDHVVVLVGDIEKDVASYETLFAQAPSWKSSGEGVSRALFTLENTTLELMAPEGDSEVARRIRAVIDEQGEGLASLCFRTPDIAGMHRRLERLALRPEPVVEVENRNAMTDETLSWKRTRAATEFTRGVRMFFLELAQERPRSVATGAEPITAIDHVVIATADPERAAALYGARLGLGMALDRSHADWGRLMFFRCGDLIVEVVHRPDNNDPNAPDRLRGICWRVNNIETTRARLVAENIDVSEVRVGRKPGTRVMSVRSGTCGVSTLLVERSPRPG